MTESAGTAESNTIETAASILAEWDLTLAQVQGVLGITSGKPAVLAESLERALAVIRLQEALLAHFSTDGHDRLWLRSPNVRPLFNGDAPIQRLLGGKKDELQSLLRIAESMAAGH